MPGFFRCSGETGQAPTTSFFGAIPDRLSMLLPMHVGPTGTNLVSDSYISALLVSSWTKFNTSFIGGTNQDSVSLGAFTLAPNGTSNEAQKIVESNANSQHFLSAGYRGAEPGFVIVGANQTPCKLRLAVFAKAAERTRIVLQFGAQDVNSASCKAVFDLANGVIAIPNTATNNASFDWAAGPASILPFGNGWYCCQIDTSILGSGGGNVSGVLGRFYLDAGSGNAAENSTYAGNGTSGVYAWKSTLLPPGAWAMNTQIFFDDFLDNSLSQIDLTNSLAPGFDWYLKESWPSFPGMQDTPANYLSCSNSVLTIQQAPDNASGIQMQTAAPLGVGAYVGTNVFRPPMLIESKWGWNEDLGDNQAFHYTSFWTTSLERMLTPPPETNLVPINIEMDWGEQLAGGAPPWSTNSLFHGPFGEQTNRQNAAIGFPLWNSVKTYGGGQLVVGYSGSLWIKANPPDTGTVPGTNPAVWTAYTTVADPTIAPDLPIVDFSQLHTKAVLWLPSLPGELGQVLNFFDGNYCGQGTPTIQTTEIGQTVYGPNGDPRNGAGKLAFQVGDGQTFPILFSAAFPISGTDGHVKIDFVRVTA